MAQDQMKYNEMVENALLGVVRTALERAAKDGLPGQHHFYIAFRTQDPGVDIADHLAAKYPDEMTIVLQHQFWGLEVHEDHFEVTLSFNKRGERLVVPFAAVSSFFDPSVQFGLQFKRVTEDEETEAGNPPAVLPEGGELTIGENTEVEPAAGDKTAESDDAAGDDNVVVLDRFRRD
jgi:hypothetical protein